MGMFKDLKNTMQQAGEAAANAPAAAAAANANAAAVQSTDIDPNDPVLEPIEGVTIERYAELCAAISSAGLKTEDEVDAWAVKQGLQAGGYKRVADGWNARMGTHRALTNRFGGLYTAAAK
ncbi:MAG: hypothetical protein ACT4PI_16335 [Actinomycetota bacterium]